MGQPVLEARAVMDIVSREEASILEFKRNSNARSAGDWILTAKEEDPAVSTFWPSCVAPVLFRGQTRIYDPCLATILRGLPLEWTAFTLRDLLLFVSRHARAAWFVEHIRHHPFAKRAITSSFDINTIGVAQHYGLPTHYMDLTESPSVAAFFATCKVTRGKTPGEIVVTPCAKDEGEGILYRVRWHNTPLHSCRPIALQPFPRPREQAAWTYELWHGEDMQTPRCRREPCVETIKFTHDLGVSKHFYELFDEGRALFPPDILAEVADQIMDSKFLPADIVRAVVEWMSNDSDWASLLPSEGKIFHGLDALCNCEVVEGIHILYTADHAKRLAEVNVDWPPSISLM